MIKKIINNPKYHSIVVRVISSVIFAVGFFLIAAVFELAHRGSVANQINKLINDILFFGIQECNIMKYTLILINLIAINFLSGCALSMDWEMRISSGEINEQEYWKTPCTWDGTIMKKEPKLTK